MGCDRIVWLNVNLNVFCWVKLGCFKVKMELVCVVS